MLSTLILTTSLCDRSHYYLNYYLNLNSLDNYNLES